MAKKICLVDDTPDLLENITRFLILEGFDVVPFANGAEAMKQLKNYRPDLIITDLWMPVMNGFDLIDMIKRNTGLANIPIVVFSAAPLQANEKESLKSRVAGYITKPVTMENLLESIHRFLP